MKFSKLIATSLLLGGICTFNSVNAVGNTASDASQVYYDNNSVDIKKLVSKYCKYGEVSSKYYIIKLNDGSSVITKSTVHSKMSLTKLTKHQDLRRKFSLGTPDSYKKFIRQLTHNTFKKIYKCKIADEKIDLSPDSLADNNTQLDAQKTQLSTNCARRLEF